MHCAAQSPLAILHLLRMSDETQLYNGGSRDARRRGGDLEVT
jgi:hypothetical protein